MTDQSDECVIAERIFDGPAGERVVLRVFKPEMVEEDFAAVELEGVSRRHGPLTWCEMTDLNVWPRDEPA